MNNLKSRVSRLEATENISDIYVFLRTMDGSPIRLTIVHPTGGNHTFTDKKSLIEYAKQHQLKTDEINGAI